MPKPGCEADYIYKGLWGMKTTIKTNEKEPGLILAPCKYRERRCVHKKQKMVKEKKKKRQTPTTGKTKEHKTPDPVRHAWLDRQLPCVPPFFSL